MSERVVFWGGSGQSWVLKEAISYGDYELISIVDNREIGNIHGEIVVLKSSLNLNKTQLSKNNLPNGVYILTLNTVNGPIVKKISFN